MTKDFVNELCRVSGGADCARRLDQGLGLQPAVFEYFENFYFADMGYLMNLMCFESNLNFYSKCRYGTNLVQRWCLTFSPRSMLSC